MKTIDYYLMFFVINCATTRCKCSYPKPKPYRGAEGTNPTCERMRSKLKQPLTA